MQDHRILVLGRVVASDSGSITADWPGTRVIMRFNGTGMQAILGGSNQYDVLVDGKWHKRIIVGEGAPQPYSLASGLEAGSHTLELARRTESLGEPALMVGILPMGSKAELLNTPPRTQRRIEFIGDSYTAGYGNESPIQTPTEDQVDSLVFATTNTQKSFAVLVSKRLGADVQVNAVSGRGLVRNFNGFSPGQEFGYLYPYALLHPRLKGQSAPKWDFLKWHPQVVVIGLGINDWQGQPPYPDSIAFDAAYAALLDSIRAHHPGVKFVLCATSVWPTEALIPRVQSVVAKELARGHSDVRYFEYRAERNGLWNHPSILDHEAIAQKLIPVVTDLAGWRSR